MTYATYVKNERWRQKPIVRNTMNNNWYLFLIISWFFFRCCENSIQPKCQTQTYNYFKSTKNLFMPMFAAITSSFLFDLCVCFICSRFFSFKQCNYGWINAYSVKNRVSLAHSLNHQFSLTHIFVVVVRTNFCSTRRSETHSADKLCLCA